MESSSQGVRGKLCSIDRRTAVDSFITVAGARPQRIERQKIKPRLEGSCVLSGNEGRNIRQNELTPKNEGKRQMRISRFFGLSFGVHPSAFG